MATTAQDLRERIQQIDIELRLREIEQELSLREQETSAPPLPFGEAFQAAQVENPATFIGPTPDIFGLLSNLRTAAVGGPEASQQLTQEREDLPALFGERESVPSSLTELSFSGNLIRSLMPRGVQAGIDILNAGILPVELKGAGGDFLNAFASSASAGAIRRQEDIQGAGADSQIAGTIAGSVVPALIGDKGARSGLQFVLNRWGHKAVTKFLNSRIGQEVISGIGATIAVTREDTGLTDIGVGMILDVAISRFFKRPKLRNPKLAEKELQEAFEIASLAEEAGRKAKAKGGTAAQDQTTELAEGVQAFVGRDKNALNAKFRLDEATENIQTFVAERKAGLEAGDALDKTNQLDRVLRDQSERQVRLDSDAQVELALGDAGTNIKGNITLRLPEITQTEKQVIRNMEVLDESIINPGVSDKDVANFFGFEIQGRIQKRMDGGASVNEGPVQQTFIVPAREAQGLADKTTRAAKDAFRKFMKERVPLGKRLGASRRIAIYAFAQEAGGTERLSAMGIKDIPALSKAEREVYDFMRKELVDIFPRINGARQAAGIVPIRQVENYFTFYRNMGGLLQRGDNLMSASAHNLNDQLPDLIRPGAKKAKQAFFPFVRRGTDINGELALDAFGIFENYVTIANKHIELSPDIARMRRLIEFKDQAGFSLRENNPVAYRALSDWLNFMGGTRVTFNKTLDKMFLALNRNVAFAMLGYNIRTVAIQVTALRNTLAEIGPRYTTGGMLELIANPSAALKKADAFSSVLVGREFDASVIESMTNIGGSLSILKNRLGEAGIKPIQQMDRLTAAATWLGAFKQGKESLKMNAKEAATWADDVVQRTQASASAVELSAIQRTAFGKAVTSLQTFIINDAGFVLQDVMGISMKNRKAISKETARKMFHLIWGTTAINSAFELMGVRSPFPQPITAFQEQFEKTGSTLAALGAALYEFVDEIPVIGGVTRFGGSIVGAGVNAISDYVMASHPRTARRPSLATSLGIIFGIPGTIAVQKYARFLKDENSKPTRSGGRSSGRSGGRTGGRSNP